MGGHGSDRPNSAHWRKPEWVLEEVVELRRAVLYARGSKSETKRNHRKPVRVIGGVTCRIGGFRGDPRVQAQSELIELRFNNPLYLAIAQGVDEGLCGAGARVG